VPEGAAGACPDRLADRPAACLDRSRARSGTTSRSVRLSTASRFMLHPSRRPRHRTLREGWTRAATCDSLPTGESVSAGHPRGSGCSTTRALTFSFDRRSTSSARSPTATRLDDHHRVTSSELRERGVSVTRARLQPVRGAQEASRDGHRARQRGAVPREDRRGALTFRCARRVEVRPVGPAPFYRIESRATTRRGEPLPERAPSRRDRALPGPAARSVPRSSSRPTRRKRAAGSLGGRP
jgi:hypothetical protein